MRSVPIGVAVVNFNGRADTLACLEALAAADPRPARVVVVDNASIDDSLDAISAWIARHANTGVDLLLSGTNRGFAGANNLALSSLASEASLTHFFLLNNDATVDARFFAEVERALAAAPAAAILGVTIYESGPAHRVWYAGGSVLRLRALGRHRHEVPRDGRVIPTEFVTGCAMLISRRAWDVLGPLPECYFIYFEDVEYCVRARAAGLPVVYAPRPVVHHLVAGAVRRGAVGAARAQYRFAKARALFARRNLRGWTRWSALSYLAVTGLARAVFQTLRGRPTLAWAAFRGTLAGLLAIEGQRDVRHAAAGERSGERVVVDQ